MLTLSALGNLIFTKWFRLMITTDDKEIISQFYFKLFSFFIKSYLKNLNLLFEYYCGS